MEQLLVKSERVDETPHRLVVGYALRDDEVREEQEQNERLRTALVMAQSANRAKTAFLSSMSHDIRTPMNAILGYTAMAKKHADDPTRVQECLDKIAVAGGNLLELINQVLDMSRIESGRVVLEEEPCNLRRTAETLMTILSSTAETAGVRLTLVDDALREADVMADTGRLNQILLNILSNAVKYTPSGGCVTLTAEQLDECREGRNSYRFTVTDTGIGMSAEFAQHLFEPFSRERTVTENRIEGTGLGMSIVKNLVDLMEGSITVRSEPGRGTEVAVTLPFEPTGTPAAAEPTLEPTGFFCPEGRRVLLVEDNEMNQEIAVDILTDAGFEVTVADDGAQAVERIAQGKGDEFDLVLMDIQMPRMNGLEAARRIRLLPQGRTIPIVALSANAFDEDVSRSLAAGMNAHIAKPIDTAELFTVLQKLL